MCGRLVDKNQSLEEQLASTSGVSKKPVVPVGMTIISSLDNPGAQVQVVPTTIPGCASVGIS